MTEKKKSKMRLKRVVFGFFFAVVAMLGLVGGVPGVVYADPTGDETAESGANDGGGAGNNSNSEANGSNNGSSGEGNSSDGSGDNSDDGNNSSVASTGDGCQASLGAIGWLVCPTTGAIAGAVDWLYDKIEEILTIDPLSQEAGSPIFEIWKFCRGVTNVVFIIFLLVVIYSQLTGVGITNYGVKKALPKLIVVAILVNLSFLICTLAVDVSNILGNSLRGLFESVEATAVEGMAENGTTISGAANAEMFSALAGGTALTIGGAVIAFETGAIWMMIPTMLGALVAVVTGLITIALRQAVVALLIMISPLAFVCYMLPNTESLFTKWRKLLTQMLVFYPMFSVLFGASSLAGFAIIASATDGFGMLLGTAVQIFPLFFSWKMMQMSNTFLGTINTKMRELGSAPIAKNRAWADSRRMATKQQRLAQGRPATPSLRLMQFVADRKVAREAETSENAELAKTRGLAYRARRNYRNGIPTKQGEESYENQARTLEYQRVIERDKNNMEKGLGQLAAVSGASNAQKARLNALDNRIVVASDNLKFEMARGEKIKADNAESFYKRTEAAMNWHMDDLHGDTRDDNGRLIYRKHDMSAKDRVDAAARYSTMNEIMEGNVTDVQFAAADAAHAYDTQKKITETKYQKYFELLPPTKDVEYRLSELVKQGDAAGHIDAILPGLRILNQRGDTDLVKAQMDNILDTNVGGGVKLGTHASQALASFLMFEVKDNDPYLRRFGKYINLETARVYNKNDRQVMNVTYDEYVKGYHDGEPVTDDRPDGRMYAKKDMAALMEGTSMDGIERTALDNYDKSLKKVYTNSNGVLDLEAYQAKRTEVDKAVGPQFISANMKFLSGSEQITAAVKAKTGFFAKQDGKTGEYSMVPIWEDEDEAKKLFGAYGTAEEKTAAKEGLKGWYREQTMGYLHDQTATQILGLRSDYHDGLREHLADAFMARDRDDLNEDQLEALREYEQEVSRIQTEYGDEPIGEAKLKRDAEMKEAREILTGAEFRRLLDSNGTLLQIYRSRRSGAANAAKPFVRKWLRLDDEKRVRDYERKKNPKSQNVSEGTGEQQSQPSEYAEGQSQSVGQNEEDVSAKKKTGRDRNELIAELQERLAQLEEEEHEGASVQSVSQDDDDARRVYDESKRQSFCDDIEDLYQDMKNASDEDFYDESLEYLKEVLSKDSYIVQEYQRMYKENPYEDKYHMRNYLIELLENPDNY